MQYTRTETATELNYAKPGDAGIDLSNSASSCGIDAGQSAIINTGIAVAIPTGYFGLVLMRSGHGFKRNLMSHPGIIDSGYRGEIKVKVFNLGHETAVIEHNERFAQIIIVPFAHMPLQEVPALEDSERGATGFGSSG